MIQQENSRIWFVFAFQENKLRMQDYAIKIRGNDCCQQTADHGRQTTRVREQVRLFRSGKRNNYAKQIKQRSFPRP
jgi:hypothetical protein